MKTKLNKTALATFAGILMVGLISCSKDNGINDSISETSVLEVTSSGTTAISTAKLQTVLDSVFTYDATELDLLLKLKEEEKLARDVYTFLALKYENQVFSNISRSENTHMTSVVYLLSEYGDEYTGVPVAGVFTIADYQKLYTDLTAKGSESLTEALKVGALIEEMDISDIVKDLESVVNANVTIVMENLERGSRNHLRAFTRQLTVLNVVYSPVFLSAEEYASIISAPIESGKRYPVNPNWRKNKRNPSCLLTNG